MNNPQKQPATLNNTWKLSWYHRFFLCLGALIFSVVSCRLSPDIQPSLPSKTASPAPASNQNLSQNQRAPAHSYPNCSPPISPYYTKGALPFLIFPNPGNSQPTLAALSEKHDLRIGSAVSYKLLNKESYASLLSREFSMITPEVDMKWENIHPEPERFNFTMGDTLVAFARLYQMDVYGHVLVWDLQLPEWIRNGEYSRDEWMQILCTHIKSVVGHYRGQVYAWDVVNEALDEHGQLRNTFWLQKIGPEYIPMAFHWAREADPNAILVYNDFMAEGMNPKSDGVYALVQELLRQNVPIDGVGLQMHTHLNGLPPFDELMENMQRLTALGMDVFITEMDIKLQYSDASLEEKLNEQATRYSQVFSACLQTPGCRGFSTWGLTDLYSWIPDYTGKEDAPLLFDRKGQPKPAYDAIIDLLQQP